MAVQSYKCPNCDAGLAFDPNTQTFACEFCSGHFTEAELLELQPIEQSDIEVENSDYTDGKTEQDDGDVVLYTCPSCGAEITTDATTAATFCYYCHNPVVLAGRLSNEMKPDLVLPFKIDKNVAIDTFMEWTKKKHFIPKGFFNKQQIEKITGVYYPYWSADYDADVFFKGEGTIVSHSSTAKEDITTTKHYEVTRNADMHFSNVMRSALSKADRKLADGVQPYDLSKAKEFSTAYLSGFMAEKRDVDEEPLRPDVEKELYKYVQNMIRNDSQYTSLSGDTTATFTNPNFKYLLLPLWVLTYKGKDDTTYYYAMNGQTKEVCGKLPFDKAKLAGFCALISAVVFALGLLGGYFI